MELIINEINSLRLNRLGEDWVQGAYYSEFLEFGEFSEEYDKVLESIDLRTVFKNIIKSIVTWTSQKSDPTEEKSWTALSSKVPHQKLLALIAYFIDYGGKHVHSKEHRNNALLASRLYYNLLSISGFKAYNIYHSQLFAHSLACLGFPKAMCESEDSYYNSKELTREVNSVIKGLQSFVLDLKAVIEKLQLSPTDMNFEDILSNMVDITGGAVVNKLANVDKIELAHVSRVIYEMIDILLCDLNGEPNSTAIRLLFKCILPKLVAASVDCRNSNNLVRASYVTYSGLLLSKFGKAALTGYMVLMQHLCYNTDGLERAEVRAARVSLVVGQMSLLPRKSYSKTVKWLLELSTTAKISHRQIAMEILFKLLNNEPEETKRQENPTETKPDEVNQPENPDEVIKETEIEPGINEGASTSTAENVAIVGDKMATDDESSQEALINDNQCEEMTEDDVAGLLRQRAHSAPHEQILRCVYERVFDVSSTLRTRAITLLTESLGSSHLQAAINDLNGSGPVPRLMSVAARCVCDERAAVRRAAVTLVHRLLLQAPLLTQTDLAILGNLCRDASILVRSAAITSLGDLVLNRPTEEVFDAFLNGPFHQLSDPETKVQEQVVNQIQLLLINRLDKYVEGGNEDLLPWMFLSGITKLNMRRHLQKACMLLSKSGNCISVRLVDILSTHLGVLDEKRDLHCLVLLTSVANLVDYSEIDFVLDYYYKLTDNLEGRDVRVLSLCVELLSAWCRWAQTGPRHALREHLVRRLATSQHECRIACATLAAQLDPDNLQWANELMQLSISRAVSGGEVQEWLRAADLSLVAPTPPPHTLLQLFLNAFADIPPDWSEATTGSAAAALGRLCVRSRSAAAAAAPTLGALLQCRTAPPAARHNALLALTDICTRYTCIVDNLLDVICSCVSREAEWELRRAAARALTRLLLAGYLRLRTPLYYTYCALIADEEHEVREPAEYYVTCCLTPDTIFHHFVDCVRHYNKETTERLSFDARQLIYDVMLQRMSLVQKLNTMCRLAREVLEHAADVCDEDDNELPAELNAALLDTITVLCGPRCKLPRKPDKTGDAADIDDLQERVTTNIVSHKMKVTVAEVVVPAVLRLYSRLARRGGQLAAYLVRIATDLLNDYRSEIEELFEKDEELLERVQQFSTTIGLDVTFGNARNLVTSSAPPEPETPRAIKRKARPRPARSPVRKRALRM